jgi:Ni,Fe-hydrogenase III large subunit
MLFKEMPILVMVIDSQMGIGLNESFSSETFYDVEAKELGIGSDWSVNRNCQFNWLILQSNCILITKYFEIFG